MGLMCSWVAIRTVAKSEVLAHLGVIETGRSVEPTEERGLMSVYQNDNGWLYVFVYEFDWADEALVADLSRFGMTLGVQMEDKVDMECVVRAADGGRALWSVAHLNIPGQELTISGDPPAELADIRQKYEALQAGEESVDYLLEIPLELARAVSGYQVLEDPIDFIELKPLQAPPKPPRDLPRGGLLARLFSAFR
jgi:hypothetical protein